MREIHGGVAIGHFNMAPAFQGCEQHEQIRRSVAFVFIIITRDTPRFRWDRRAGFGDQLLRRLIQTYQGALWIVGLVINLQHIFHVRHERRICLRRNDKLLVQVRLENVVFSVRPIVLSLARGTMFNSTTLSSKSRKVHFARPLGGSEQAREISLASAAPSKVRRLAELGDCLRRRTASRPSSTRSWRVRNTVDRLVSKAATIRRSLQLSPASEISALSRIRDLRTWTAGRLPVRMNASSVSRSAPLSRMMYFLTAFSDMIRFSPTFATLLESHGTVSESRTWGTRIRPQVVLIRPSVRDGSHRGEPPGAKLKKTV